MATDAQGSDVETGYLPLFHGERVDGDCPGCGQAGGHSRPAFTDEMMEHIAASTDMTVERAKTAMAELIRKGLIEVYHD